MKIKLLLMFICVFAIFNETNANSNEVDEKSSRAKRSAPTDQSKFWPKGVVYYSIDRHAFNLTEINMIKEAMNKISYYSYYTFIEIMNSNSYYNDRGHIKYYDMIKIVNGKDCSSYVGRQGGAQELSLNKGGCFKQGIILHELMHAVGFEHEQNRYDRDQYVIIHWDNIPIDQRRNFIKKEDYTTRFGNYDYNSVMHYSPYAFSINEFCTISSYQNVPFGFAIDLSQGDINGLRRSNGLGNWTTRETHGAYSSEGIRDMENLIRATMGGKWWL